MAEFSGRLAEREPAQKSVSEVMLRVATIAISQGMWPLATELLERLDKLSGGSYNAAEVYYKCGLTFCLWADSIETPQRRIELLQKAESWLHRAMLAGEKSTWPHRHWIYFWLAYAEDNLGRYRHAIQHNAEALALQGKLAPAKYNKAISWIKLGSLKRACRVLQSIESDDEDLDLIAGIAPEDDELKELLESPDWGPTVKKLLKSWQEWASPTDLGS
jgi:tetratricopeptide (TPR) repeat protein